MTSAASVCAIVLALVAAGCTILGARASRGCVKFRWAYRMPGWGCHGAQGIPRFVLSAVCRRDLAVGASRARNPIRCGLFVGRKLHAYSHGIRYTAFGRNFHPPASNGVQSSTRYTVARMVRCWCETCRAHFGGVVHFCRICTSSRAVVGMLAFVYGRSTRTIRRWLNRGSFFWCRRYGWVEECY